MSFRPTRRNLIRLFSQGWDFSTSLRFGRSDFTFIKATITKDIWLLEMLKVPYLLQPATLRKLCHFDQRGEISSIYLFNSIRPLRCGRGDQLFITTYQTMLTLPMLHILCYYNLYTKLCHFDQRGEISSIYLFNSIRPLRCGRGDRIFAMLQTISGHIERSRDI